MSSSWTVLIGAISTISAASMVETVLPIRPRLRLLRRSRDHDLVELERRLSELEVELRGLAADDRHALRQGAEPDELYLHLVVAHGHIEKQVLPRGVGQATPDGTHNLDLGATNRPLSDCVHHLPSNRACLCFESGGEREDNRRQSDDSSPMTRSPTLSSFHGVLLWTRM